MEKIKFYFPGAQSVGGIAIGNTLNEGIHRKFQDFENLGG
jgi:hypothetical protein